jgi:hypothetical protein
MMNDENIVEVEHVEEAGRAEPAEEAVAESKTVTEEIKVQTDELVKAVENVIHEGTARRITIMRNDRILVDIPLVVGLGASVLFAVYMPLITAIAGMGALLAGCTLRIEREEAADES